MVHTLLSRVFKRYLLSKLLLLLFISSSSLYAQTVLLPSDVVVVSVNASNNSFDFIPLVKLDKETSLFFSNGSWNSQNQKINTGESIEITFLEPIEAGTNIHVNNNVDPRVEIEGKLNFNADGNRLIAYQIDEGVTRVLYGIGWGNAEVWNVDSPIGSSIPKSISKKDKTLLILGDLNNYQYYLRNGASGTQTMLLNFVGDPANWRGSNQKVYPSFGTTFRKLSPPVIMFDESISTVAEGESIVLSVAIFEHDGSRLTVDANFNMYNSTADTSDLKIPEKYTFNFTGLIGNAVYSKEIPIIEDENYESTETAYFELENLSKGNLGDFVSHLALIPDSKIPAIKITGLSYSGNADSDFIEIQNSERVEADLSGWKLESKDFEYKFEYGTFIPAVQKIRIFHPKSNQNNQINDTWLKRNSGTLLLKNQNDELVSKLAYQINSNEIESYSTKDVTKTEIVSHDVSLPELSLRRNSVLESKIATKTPKESGWYTISTDDLSEIESSSKKIYIWNEKIQNFELLEGIPNNESFNSTYIAYFNSDELLEPQDADTTELSSAEFLDEEFQISISSTDSDDNGIINNAEGFNFITNPTKNSLLVENLINEIETHLFDGAIYPYIYLWENDGKGWLSSRVLTENDIIPPGSSFWIRADSIFESTQVTIPVVSFIDHQNQEEEFGENKFSFSIKVETGETHRDVSIKFYDEDKPIKRDVLSPELEHGLIVANSNFLFAGLGSGLSWNTELNVYALEDQKLVFPLTIKSSLNGTYKLSVSNWNRFPLDWKIYIEDLETEKMHLVDQNWSLEFEDFDQTLDNNFEFHELDFSDVDINEKNNQRFNLIIVPPGFEESIFTAPDKVSLYQNYPNPFNPNTIIAFYLPESVAVKLSIFNIVGQPIAVLTEGTLGAGDHEFEWDATGLPTGMYIYQLEVGNSVMTQKMTLVK